MTKSRHKQKQVNFRTTDELQRRLDAAAKRRDHSLNKEINRRLEESLVGPDRADQTYVPGLLAVAAAMNSAGVFACISSFKLEGSESWWNDPYAFDQAVQAANRVFEAMRPVGPITKPKNSAAIRADLVEHVGVGCANHVLSEVEIGEQPRAPKLRSDLGDALVQRVKQFNAKVGL